MDLRMTSIPPHFGHFFSPLSTAFASLRASPVMFFDLQFGFRQNSFADFFLSSLTIGNLQTSHSFLVALILAPLAKLTVVLHAGYSEHAAKLPNFPFLIIRFPFPHAGHFPSVFIVSLACQNACFKLSPTTFSCFLKSFTTFAIASFASPSTTA